MWNEGCDEENQSHKQKKKNNSFKCSTDKIYDSSYQYICIGIQHLTSSIYKCFAKDIFIRNKKQRWVEKIEEFNLFNFYNRFFLI